MEKNIQPQLEVCTCLRVFVLNKADMLKLKNFTNKHLLSNTSYLEKDILIQCGLCHALQKYIIGKAIIVKLKG